MFRLAMRVVSAFWAGLARGSLRLVGFAIVAGAVFYFHNELAAFLAAIAKLIWLILTGLSTLTGLLLAWLGALLEPLRRDRPPTCDSAHVLDASKRICVLRCSAGSTFEPSSGQCIPKCSAGYVLNATTMQCERIVADSKVKLRQLDAVMKDGRHIELHLADFSASCFWRHNEKEIVDCEATTSGAPAPRFDELLRAAVETLSKADRLVLVGTASKEGELVAQVGVALARARQLARWIGEKTNHSGGLALVNLGQFLARNCTRCAEADTRWQRPIIIIGVVPKLTDADLTQAILSLLDGRDKSLPIRAYYSIAEPAIVPFSRQGERPKAPEARQ